MWHWLVKDGEVYHALVGWAVGVVMTGVVIGLIVRPALRKLKHAWRQHEATQKTIASRLDPNTPGGLGDLPKAVAEEVSNIERGEE